MGSARHNAEAWCASPRPPHVAQREIRRLQTLVPPRYVPGRPRVGRARAERRPHRTARALEHDDAKPRPVGHDGLERARPLVPQHHAARRGSVTFRSAHGIRTSVSPATRSAYQSARLVSSARPYRSRPRFAPRAGYVRPSRAMRHRFVVTNSESHAPPSRLAFTVTASL